MLGSTPPASNCRRASAAISARLRWVSRLAASLVILDNRPAFGRDGYRTTDGITSGLGHGRAAVRPGPLGLDLGGEREQRRLVVGPADELHRQWQALPL